MGSVDWFNLPWLRYNLLVGTLMAVCLLLGYRGLSLETASLSALVMLGSWGLGWGICRYHRQLQSRNSLVLDPLGRPEEVVGCSGLWFFDDRLQDGSQYWFLPLSTQNGVARCVCDTPAGSISIHLSYRYGGDADTAYAYWRWNREHDVQSGLRWFCNHEQASWLGQVPACIDGDWLYLAGRRIMAGMQEQLAGSSIRLLQAECRLDIAATRPETSQEEQVAKAS